MDDLFQALEVAVVSIYLDEVGRRPLVDVAQCRGLEPAAVLRRQWLPARVDGRRLAERMAVGDEAANARIDKRRAARVGDIAELIRLAFGVVRQVGIGGRSDIAGGEIGEKRIFARSAVAMAIVAFRLAAEQLISPLLLRRELSLPGLVHITALMPQGESTRRTRPDPAQAGSGRGWLAIRSRPQLLE
jgi:hypothetical protein